MLSLTIARSSLAPPPLSPYHIATIVNDGTSNLTTDGIST